MNPNQGELQRYFFAVGNEPYCIWGWNLSEKNLHFLRNIDPGYFLYLAKTHSQCLDGESKNRATIALRTAYYHSLETLFSLIFAAIQSPAYPLAWILKAKPRQVRELVKRVGTGGEVGPLRLNLENPDWKRISALINGTAFLGLPNRDLMVEKFAVVWRRFADEYADQFLTDEYNGIKHGFRTHLEGWRISFVPSDDPSKVPNPDEFTLLGESKLGSSFLVPEPIEGSPIKKRGADLHFWLKEHHVNSHPARIDLALELVSASINNVCAFLRIINKDGQKPEIQLQYPDKEEEFAIPWQTAQVTPSLRNFTTNQKVKEHQIERLDKKEILKRLKLERESFAENQVRHYLGFLMRQTSGSTLPREVPMTPDLEKLTDRATAQKIWDELLAKCKPPHGAGESFAVP